jgi:hypothetical protein
MHCLAVYTSTCYLGIFLLVAYEYKNTLEGEQIANADYYHYY